MRRPKGSGRSILRELKYFNVNGKQKRRNQVSFPYVLTWFTEPFVVSRVREVSGLSPNFNDQPIGFFGGPFDCFRNHYSLTPSKVGSSSMFLSETILSEVVCHIESLSNVFTKSSVAPIIREPRPTDSHTTQLTPALRSNSPFNRLGDGQFPATATAFPFVVNLGVRINSIGK